MARASSRSVRRKPPAASTAAARRNAVEMALAGLAHEVRTPLNGILALSELLAASDLPAREREWANDLREAADHIAKLTTLVVDGARSRACGLELQDAAFRPRAFAETLARSLSARAQVAGLTAHAALAAALPPAVSGDSVRLRGVLENLIDNAVKFTPRGGSVTLSVAAKPEEQGRVILSFALVDGGIGLERREIALLFRPFAQANAAVARRFGGGGLGLSLARNIARAMGGDITVDSAAGAGSTFRLTVRLRIVAESAVVDGDDGHSDLLAAIACARRETPA